MVEITYLLMDIWTLAWSGQGCYSCGGGVTDPSLLRLITAGGREMAQLEPFNKPASPHKDWRSTPGDLSQFAAGE